MKNVCLLYFLLILFQNPTLAQPTVILETFASGLAVPVDIANAGDERLFVVEKAGVIRIVNPDGIVLPTPFLDIRSRRERRS